MNIDFFFFIYFFRTFEYCEWIFLILFSLFDILSKNVEGKITFVFCFEIIQIFQMWYDSFFTKYFTFESEYFEYWFFFPFWYFFVIFWEKTLFLLFFQNHRKILKFKYFTFERKYFELLLLFSWIFETFFTFLYSIFLNYQIWCHIIYMSSNLQREITLKKKL